VARLRAMGDVPLGDALLNQRAVAGIGNVFKSEVCFAARLSPLRSVGTLDVPTVRAVVEIARHQLRANVPDSRASAVMMWNQRRRTTRRAHPDQALWVYGRAGEPCRSCATLIAMVKQGPDARVTYYCPACQKAEG
jgi:endonuclease-8